jgi:NAD(P)-dependent dehydrogenase (short-subunit alcohol dehydrogenase family)
VPTTLITGANRGLGLEFVRQYADDGWRIHACCRRPSEELDAISRDNRKVTVFPLDVADHVQIERLSRTLQGEDIDVLLNNAGVLGRVPFASGGVEAQAFGRMDYDDWSRILRINVFGPMRMAECFLPHVLRSGQKKIVTLTSMLGSMGLNTIGGLYGYRSSKAAINAVMMSMSVDLQRQGVLAVALHPGWVKTEMGGSGADIDASTSVQGLRRVIAGLKLEDLGRVYAYDGSPLPY